MLLKEFEQLMLLTLDILEMDRSNRRGGEKSARFDRSIRHDMFDETDGFASSLVSSCVGLKNNARFDVSLVAAPHFGTVGISLLALFFSELGVFRPRVLTFVCYETFIFMQQSAKDCLNIPGVLRFPNARRFGVDTFSFLLNFLETHSKRDTIELERCITRYKH